jgi:hypothetical protein
LPPLDWDGFYRAARAMGLSPNEFWDMTLPEFLEEIDIQTGGNSASKFSETEWDDLKDWMDNGYE